MGNYLLTYTPLCDGGQPSSEDPPFADGSIRREPDLQTSFPSVTALCRAGRFAPHRAEGDEIAYLTRKGAYLDDRERGWRLVAHLKVIHRLESHAEAAAWYQTQGYELPSNCMVKGNAALPVERSHSPSADHRSWDAGYWHRSRKHGVFLICQALWRNLVDPPQLLEKDLKSIFGRIPGTQSGVEITPAERNQLLARAQGSSKLLMPPGFPLPSEYKAGKAPCAPKGYG